MPLPPRGSAQDELLMAVHQRDLEAKFTEVAVLVAVMTGSADRRDALLKTYHEYLFEDAYNPNLVRERKKAALKAKQTKVDQAKLMDKADKLTVEAPLPVVPKKGAKRKRR